MDRGGLARRLVAVLLWCLLLVGAGAGPALAGATAGPRVIDVGLFISDVHDLNFVSGSYKVVFWAWYNYDDPAFRPTRSIEIIGARDLRVLAESSGHLPEGRHQTWVKYMATINQDWDVRWFPYDRQQLHLALESIGENSSRTVLRADQRNSRFDANITLPGWSIAGMTFSAEAHRYPSDFGSGDEAQTTFSRVTATVNIQRAGGRVLGTAFLGFFAADILTATTLVVESVTSLRQRIPFLGRLNMIVGALFGAVGNKYISDSSLPPMPVFSLPDLIQLNSFSAICFGLITVIGNEALAGAGVPPPLVTLITRSAVGTYLLSQVALAGYFWSNARQAE